MTPKLESQIKALLARGDETKAVSLLREKQKLRLSEAMRQIATIKKHEFDREPQDAAYIFSSIFRFILISVMALSGFLAAPGALRLIDYQDVDSWPTTLGKVVESERYQSMLVHADAPRIRYQYTVNGKNYFSLRWGFPLVDAGFGSDTKGVLARYPEGARVTVYYDQDQPGRATLEPYLGSLMIRVLTFPISLLLFLWYRGFHTRLEARSRLKMRARSAGVD